MKKIINIILILILPIIIIISFVFLGNTILNYYNLNLNDYINITIEEYISIYLSILSIEVSAILAIAIYRWQHNDEKRGELEEIRHAKRILRVLLTNATKKAFEVYNSYDEDSDLDYNFIRVTDNHIGLIATIGHLLTEKEFLYLNLLMETLKDMAENEKNDYLYEANSYLEKYMKLITLPFYPLYHFKMAQPGKIYDVMNKDAIQIFNLLIEKECKEDFYYGVKYNSNKEILFENCDNGYFKVYDSYGDILCDCLIDGQGIINGNAKEFTDGIHLEFEGDFRNRKRHGQGIEYFTEWFSGEIKKTGIWKDNSLVTGIIYKVILDNKNELYTIEDGEEYIQLYDKNYTINDFVNYAPEVNIATINIDNEKIKVVKDSIIPLAIVAQNEGYSISMD